MICPSINRLTVNDSMRTILGRTLATAAVIPLITATAAAESWELRPAAAPSPGSAEIEAGRPDDAIRILIPALEAATARSRLAILENLCVAYALKQEYDKAMRFCNRAAADGAASATTLNNRGVVRAVSGDHRGAIRDFQRAGCLRDCGIDCDTSGVRAALRRNLARLNERQSTTDQSPVYFRRGV